MHFIRTGATAMIYSYTILLFLLARSINAQTSAINDLIQDDIKLVGPGVRLRLTPMGTAYVTSMVAKMLVPEVAVARMPFETRSATFASLPTIGLDSMQLRLFDIPEAFDIATAPPNIVVVGLHNSTISVAAVGSGHVDDVPLAGPLEIRTSRFLLEVGVEVKRNTRGNPGLKLEFQQKKDGYSIGYRIFARRGRPWGKQLDMNPQDLGYFVLFHESYLLRAVWVAFCRVANNLPVTVDVQNPLTPETGVKFADAVSRDGHTVFEELICPRLVFLIEKRINQRFGLLATRIALGDLNNFDLVKSILASQQELRRRSVNMNRLRDVPMQHAASARVANRVRRQTNTPTFLRSFNLSRANSLILDYAMLDGPFMSSRGIEMSTSGEISSPGQKTPFGPHPLVLPTTVSPNLLQLVVSDYVPNALMYHGHLIGLFNTRIDTATPQLGPVMRTTCDVGSGSLFCVGDLFPTLRDLFPNRGVVFSFSTIKAPAVVVRQPERGGIRFQMLGLIEVAMTGANSEAPIGSMEIHIDASMKMRMSAKTVRGKVNLETIRLVTRSPQTLVQDELDDAGFLSREILQRMVNDILKQGIPIPVHPLFKLQRPKLSLAERSMVLETNFQLNQNIIRQLISEKLA